MLSMLYRLCAVFLLTVPVPSAAIPRPASHAVTDTRINLAGRQRMLTQRMAKASCFVMIGVAPDGNAVESKHAADEFAKSLNVLRLGDATLGFEAESNVAIIEALDGVDILWRTYGPAIRQLYSQDRHNVVVEQFLRLNVKILDQMDQVVNLIEFHHADTTMPTFRAATVNIAGRQRMLSQRIAKELCLIFAGIQSSTHKTLLAGAMAQFDAALEILTTGDASRGVAAPPHDRARDALDIVAREWLMLRPMALRAADGGVLTHKDMNFIANQSNILLRAAHTAVLTYL